MDSRSKRRKQEHNRPKLSHHLRLSREAILFLQMVAAHDKRPQGDLVEDWARAAYAWRLFGNRVITVPRAIGSSLRRLWEWDLMEQDRNIMIPLMFRFDHMPIYGKPYFYLRMAWDKLRIRLAAAILALEARLLHHNHHD